MTTVLIVICVCAFCALAGISFWIYRKKYIPIKHTERYDGETNIHDNKWSDEWTRDEFLSKW